MKDNPAILELKANTKDAWEAFEAAKVSAASQVELLDATRREFEAVEKNFQALKTNLKAAKSDMEARAAKAAYEKAKAEYKAAEAEYKKLNEELVTKGAIIDQAQASKEDPEVIAALRKELDKLENLWLDAATQHELAKREHSRAEYDYEKALAAKVDFENVESGVTNYKAAEEAFKAAEQDFKPVEESYKEKIKELQKRIADKGKLQELALKAAEQAIAVFKAHHAQLSKQYKFNKKVPDKKILKEDLKELANLASEAERAFKEYAALYDPKVKLHLRLEHILHKAASYYDLSYQVRDKQISSRKITKEHASVQQSFDEIDSLMNRFNTQVREGTDKVVKSEQARFNLFEAIYNQAIHLKDEGAKPDSSVKNNFNLFHSRNDSKKTGYAGVAYLSNDGTELIIGSPPMMLFKDIRSITALYHGFVPNQFDQSLKPFLDDIMEKLSAEGIKPKITLTGFSLGAVLSDLGAAYLHEHGHKVSTHGIDNPGTGKLGEKIREDTRKELLANKKPLLAPKTSQPDIHNYVMSEQTIANSVNSQAGTVHIISNPEEDRELTQQYRPDRIFGIRHLMNFKTGFDLHNEASYRLSDSAPVLNTLKIEDKKQNSASSTLRVSTSCLVVALLAPFLIAATPFIAIGVGIQKLASAIKEYCNKDNSQSFHKENESSFTIR